MLPLFVFAFLIVLAFTNLAHAQDLSAFISIDCGLPANTSYPNSKTGLTYTSDESFVDTGVSKPVSPAIRANNLDQELWYLRSFPDEYRNCYHIDVNHGHKYLVRAMFFYGNYDGLYQYPTFDLHLGPNKWVSVRIVNISSTVAEEIIYVSPLNYLDICLVKTGRTTPFISALEVRPLRNDSYVIESGLPVALFTRLDLGSSTDLIVRYPDDVYDRRWLPYHFILWTDINTTQTIDLQSGTAFQPPSVVMSSANVPTNASSPLGFYIDTQNSSSFEFYTYMHFAEIEKLQTNESRQFNITLNDIDFYGPVTPNYLYSTTVYSTSATAIQDKYDFSMFKVGGSTRPPLLNAIEVYYVVEFPQLQTEQGDIDAIAKIKTAYEITRNWQGDPCAPQVYSWQGLNCSYNHPESDPPRIVTLNLSSSGLTGVLSPDIADLKLLTSLDLSNNNLTGAIPDFLSHLPSLKFLNLTRNNLTGTVPPSLYEKSQSGSLNLSVDGNPNLCTSTSCGQGKEEEEKKSIVVPVVASVGGVLLLLVIIAALSTKLSISKRRKREVTTETRSSTRTSHEQEPLEGNRRQFSYFDVLKMTNNLGTALGKGGFGTVYHGILDGKQVAVKLLAPSSTQGYKEFKAEVKVLLRVHHKNLTALVGYCDEGTHMGLIYEYMANGNLKRHLSDGMLSWESRLRIALEAAQGLEYLHNGCKPPIVHRDVKSTNILLNENFQAKLADFGLSRAFLVESGNHVSTAVAGTPGYLDPECLETNWSTEKSDVYSFGVVLLEITAGRPVIIKSQISKTSHIIDWVRSRIQNGDIKNVIDARLQGNCDINSLWKVVEIAMACVDVDSSRRPKMNQVVTELSECLAMEMARTRGGKSAPSPLVTVNLNDTGLSPLLR